jgi:hypothetical protein
VSYRKIKIVNVHAMYVFDCMLSGVVCRLPTLKLILGMHLDILILSIMILLLLIIIACLLYEGYELCYCLIILFKFINLCVIVLLFYWFFTSFMRRHSKTIR